jgi:hypothetical protein
MSEGYLSIGRMIRCVVREVGRIRTDDRWGALAIHWAGSVVIVITTGQIGQRTCRSATRAETSAKEIASMYRHWGKRGSG